MRDFLDELDSRLAILADEHPDLDPTPAPAPPARRRRRPALLGGLTALIATAAAAFTMTGTSLADLAILSTPTTDATAIKARAGAAAKAGVDFSKAHVFGTPGGPGYALVNKTTDTICLVVPDAATPGDYGSTCKRPLARVEREGMLLQSSGDTQQDPDATSLSVLILPEDAEEVRLQVGKRPADPQITAGVVVIEHREEAILSWSQDGQRREEILPGPFETTGIQFACPDGSMALAPPLSPNLRGQAVNDAVKAARKKACGR